MYVAVDLAVVVVVLLVGSVFLNAYYGRVVLKLRSEIARLANPER